MKRMLLGVAGLMALMTQANAAEGMTSVWFDETLAEFRMSHSDSGEWVTAAGRWLPQPGDRSSCSSSDHKVYLETGAGELSYRPCELDGNGKPTSTTKKSGYNTFTKVVVEEMTLTAYVGGDEWDALDRIPLAGIALRRRAAGDCTFIGWVSTRDASAIAGRWIELAADDVAAAENVAYKVCVETDFGSIPNRVRYLVNDRPLKDADGNAWFSIRKASLDPAASPKVRAEKLSFKGVGSVGRIVAETTAAPVARGAVTVPRLERPRPGETLDAATFGFDGPALGELVTYRWYLTDAAGREVAGSERGTAATYELTADDYGHWVTVDVSDENGYYGTGKLWFSDLPVVYIDCKDAKGWVEAMEDVAVDGKVYYWADDADVCHPIEGIVAGVELAPFREQYGKLFLQDVKTVWPTAAKEDHKAYITITGNDEWNAQYVADGTVEDGKEIVSKIHVRGNSTAGCDKKPYKIKLGKKADPFGLGGGVKNKHWVLLANCFDESLMRNKISYDYSDELGLVAMHSTWVDVVMNGKFVGNYQLCQHIRVSEERVNIYDWSTAYEKIAAAAQKANPELTDDDVSEIESLLEEQQGWMTDGKFTYLGTNYTTVAKGTAGPDGEGGFTVVWKNFSTDISGGYIFELDFRKCRDNKPWTFSQSHDYAGKSAILFELAMNTPEFCFSNAAVSNYIWDCWSAIGKAWTSGTGYAPDGRHYTELCDFDSMVNYWLAVYVPGNNDAVRMSRYAYKDLGGKVVFGPAWDYDWGVGSLQVRSAVTNADGSVHYAPAKATGWIPGATAQNFMGTWNADPYFMYRLRERYWATRQYLADIVREGGLIDQYKRKLEASARANDLRWNNRIGFFGNPQETGDADSLKNYLADRFVWLDEQFSSTLGAALGNLTKTVAASGQRYARATTIVPTVTGATPVSDSTETDLTDVELEVKAAPIAVTVAVPTANAVALDVYVNGLSNGTFAVSAETSEVTIPAVALKMGEKNFVQFVAKKADGSALANNVALVRANLPTAVDVGNGADQAPAPVTMSWMDAAFEKFVEAKAVEPEKAPKSYADYVAFAKAPSPIGKAYSLWQDFVADTAPADANDIFEASIEFVEDGLPRVSWRPDRSDKDGAVVRRYVLRGTNDLATDPKNWESIAVDGADDPASEAFRRAHHFFTVEVSMPTGRTE